MWACERLLELKQLFISIIHTVSLSRVLVLPYHVHHNDILYPTIEARSVHSRMKKGISRIFPVSFSPLLSFSQTTKCDSEQDSLSLMNSKSGETMTTREEWKGSPMRKRKMKTFKFNPLCKWQIGGKKTLNAFFLLLLKILDTWKVKYEFWTRATRRKNDNEKLLKCVQVKN